jgi:hypothetical protein
VRPAGLFGLPVADRAFSRHSCRRVSPSFGSLPPLGSRTPSLGSQRSEPRALRSRLLPAPFVVQRRLAPRIRLRTRGGASRQAVAGG